MILSILLSVATAIATAQTAAPKKSVKDLKFKPLGEIKIPEISSFTLPNGMRVHLLENHELPLVRGNATIRVGNVFDPADKTGLADVFDQSLRLGGTKDKTGDQINQLLENIAASVESGVGETSGSLSFNTLREHSDVVLGIFHDLLVAPEFRQDKIDVVKTQLRSAIARRNDNASGITSREFSSLLYGPTTPWGRDMEYETLERVSRDDLIAYHKRFYFPSNVILSISGDFVSSTLHAKLEKMFADWTVKQNPAPAFPPVTHKAKPGIHLAEKPDVTQAFFRLGHMGGLLSDKDYPALEVMNDILGGNGFSSRLMQKVRSDMGLAYNVSSSWGVGFHHPGLFSITGGTKSSSIVDALKAVYGEVERIRTNEVTDEELQIAKDSTLNSFVFNFASPAQTLGRLITYEYNGYPKDFLFQYQKAVAAVTKADVLRVAKQYLKPEEFVVVVTGNSKDFGTQLTALNQPVAKIDLTIPEPKRAAAKMDAGSMAKGKQLLAELQKAVGGADKLAAVQDYSHTADVSLTSGQGGMKVTQITQVIPPAIRFEQVLPFGRVIIFSDGKGSGWLKTPQGEMPMPAQVAKQAAEELFRVQPWLWLSDRDPNRTVNATGARTVEISDKSNNWIKLTLAENGLLEKVNFKGGDGSVEAEAVYSDWKDVNGLKLPHGAKLSQGGKPAADISVKEYRINSGLKMEELGKK
ncbi:MAG: insulinase family protein [Acidobacteria bacterium]|nr:insulinase family protein [Acidobacteriota bacterium]